MDRKPMRTGKAEKGSQHCLQRWVNERGEELADRIVSASPSLSAFAPAVKWVSPLAATDFLEYRDDFLRPFNLQGHEPALREFWPVGGPQWDGLAEVRGSGASGVLLVEAKAHPGETNSTCQASEASREKIAAALEGVRTFMGASEADWLTGSYQLANRIAFLYFLNEVAGIPSWLALVNFVDDTGHKPTSLREWRNHQQALFRGIGIHPGCRLLDRIITVHVPARGATLEE